MYILENIKHFILNLFTRVYSLFTPIKKKVIFESFHGRQYSDNPKAVSEKMHELFPDYEIVWGLNSFEDKYEIIPDYVRKVKKNSLAFYKELASSFCYVTNEGIFPNIYKRKGQFFVQTWHGDRSIKKVLYDVEDGALMPFKLHDGKKTDIAVAGSDKGEELYRSAFRYYGNVLKVGSPRNDGLINCDCNNIQNIKKRLSIDCKKKIVLYAPTFRDNATEKQSTNIDIHSVLKSLRLNGGDWIALIRAHSSSKGLDINENDLDIMNVTDYPDMSDLLMASDMLISDYSSCSGDFIITGRPTILAVFDKQDYVNECRDFYFNLEDSGFILAETQDELDEILREYGSREYENSRKAVSAFFGIKETGRASEEVCKCIDCFYKKLRG